MYQKIDEEIIELIANIVVANLITATTLPIGALQYPIAIVDI